MRRWLLLGLLLMLGACGSATSPHPAPPGGLPSDVDLAPILVDSADLPSDYVRDAPEAELMITTRFLPTSDRTLTVEFSHPKGLGGFAVIWVYNERRMDDVYDLLVQAGVGKDAAGVSGVGEQAAQSTTPLGTQPATFLAFVRCQAVVLIEGVGSITSDPATLMTWAQHIDKRIQRSAICSA